MEFKKRHPIKIPTPERLTNVALHYLGRYAASEASLRRVLSNRIKRAAMRDAAFGADIEKHNQLHLVIETIIEKHRKTGVLNDAAYAAMKRDSLRRSGRSKRAIQQKLMVKGIGRTLIEETMAGGDDDPAEVELRAAQKLAKRKKLGPFRIGKTDRDRHNKDIATMARAGFTFDVIKKILGGEMPEIDAF